MSCDRREAASSSWSRRSASALVKDSSASSCRASSRARCVAMARRLLELMPMMADALVSIAGATINESAAKGPKEESMGEKYEV